MDLAGLTESIIVASRNSFSDMIDQRKGERFYAFILYTGADCCTVLPSADSIEKHEEKIAREGVEDPAEMAGFQWSIGEWAYESWQAEAFNAIPGT